MTTTAIRTRGLTHRYGRVVALEQVDLTVAPGEIYGFLGRNGAGKTTLIRALLGLITPASGEVTVLGTSIRGARTPARLWARVGYLVEGPGLYPALTVTEHLQLAARYRRLPQSAVDAVTDRLRLAHYATVRARVLSMGNRQRLGLALALLHQPELLVLDEPVNGLDPAGVVEMRQALRSLADDGVTVFMSTHIIGEVAKLADRVGIIQAGRLIEELSRESLRAAERERFVTTFRTPDLARRASEMLISDGVEARVDQCSVVSSAAEAVEQPDRMAMRLVTAGIAPCYLAVEREDLEQRFLRLTGTGQP